MNRFLSATLGVLLAVTVADVSAQGRGRDEGRVEASGDGQSKDNNYQGSRSGGEQNRGGGGDGRSDRGSREMAPQQYGRGQGEARGQVYGLSQPGQAASQGRDRGGSQWSGNQAGAGQTYGLGQFVNSEQGQGRGNDHQGRGGSQGYADGGRGNGWQGSGNSGRGYGNSGYGNSGYGDNRRGHGNGGRYDNDGRGRGGYGNNYGRGGYSSHGWRDHNWRRSWNHGWSGSRYRAPSRYYYPSGYRQSYWSIGLIVPRAYYAPNYYVNYSSYGLAAPPYGCHWVRVQNDVLLIDIATGEVVDILYGFFY
jgi:Ni/Co efflux regulator RcnB